MSRTLLGGLLVVIGAVALILSALADSIGVGSEGTGFGWKQVVGVVVGAIVMAIGAIVFLRGRRSGGEDSGGEEEPAEAA